MQASDPRQHRRPLLVLEERPSNASPANHHGHQIWSSVGCNLLAEQCLEFLTLSIAFSSILRASAALLRFSLCIFISECHHGTESNTSTYANNFVHRCHHR